MENEHTEILLRYFPIADMIVATFGSNCEVVVHDLSNYESSLVYIAGSVTGRKIGAPTTDVILQHLRQYGDDVKDLLGFTSRTRDGKIIKTSTSFIRNKQGKVIGYIGINFDITAFSMVNHLIREFIVTKDIEYIDKSFDESYANSIEEVFEHIIENTLKDIGVPVERMTRDEKVYFVKKLDEKGIFLIHGSIEKISERLGVSKQTIYNYLEENKKSNT